MDTRHRGRDISFPITLILIGLLALWLKSSEGDWTLWRLVLLLVPVFILSGGLNLAAEYRRMAAAVVVTAGGAALLAQGLGLVNWSAWGVVARAWPLAIVALGIDVALGRTSAARLLLGALVGVVTVAGIVMVFGVQPLPVTPPSVYHTTHPVDGVEAAGVTIRPAVASFILAAAPEPASVIEMDVSPDPGEAVTDTYERAGDRALVEIAYTGETANLWPGLSVGRMPRWTAVVSPDVAADLVVDIGVGSCRLDLSELDVRSLDLHLGLGECTVFLPSGSTQVEIDSGIGQTTLVLPEHTEARIHLDDGLKTVSIEGDMVRDEDEVYTPGYESTATRSEITVKQGIGSVIIKRQ